MRETGRFATRRWTPADDEILRSLALNGVDPRAIGSQLHRTTVAVRSRARRLNISPKENHGTAIRWAEGEVTASARTSQGKEAMGKRSTWTSKDDDQLRALSCGIWRELRSDRCAAESHCSWCSQTGYGLGRPVGRLEERVAAEGETVGIFPWPNIVNFQDRLDQKTKYFERMDLTAKMIPLMVEAVEKMAALGADREHIIRFLQATIEEMREQ